MCVLLCAIKIHRPKQLKACFIASPSKKHNKLYPNNFSGWVSDKHPLASLVASSFFPTNLKDHYITNPNNALLFSGNPSNLPYICCFLPTPKKLGLLTIFEFEPVKSKALSRPSICFKRLHLKKLLRGLGRRKRPILGRELVISRKFVRLNFLCQVLPFVTFLGVLSDLFRGENVTSIWDIKGSLGRSWWLETVKGSFMCICIL